MLDFIENLADMLFGYTNPNNNTVQRVSHSYTQRTNQSSDDNDVVELLRDIAEVAVSIKKRL